MLSGFAIAQPLLDVTGKSPDFFLFRRADRLDIVALVLGVTLLPALFIWGFEVAVGIVSESGQAPCAPGRRRRAVQPAGHPGGQEADRPARPPGGGDRPGRRRGRGRAVRQDVVAAAVAALPGPRAAGVRPGLPAHVTHLQAGAAGADRGLHRPGPGGHRRRQAAAGGDDLFRRVPAQVPAGLQGPDRQAGLPQLRRAGRPVHLVPQRHRGVRVHPLGDAGHADRPLPGQGQGPLLHRVPRQHAHAVRQVLRPERLRDHQPALPTQPSATRPPATWTGSGCGPWSGTRPGSTRRSSRPTTPPSTRAPSSTRRPPRSPRPRTASRWTRSSASTSCGSTSRRASTTSWPGSSRATGRP